MSGVSHVESTEKKSSARASKLLELDALAERLSVLRAEGKKLVLCHGVFDLLHIGHIRHFGQAKRLGDVLVVTVTPDQFVNKGPHRPVFHEQLRGEAIAALDSVDYVAINQWPSAVETIQLLRPNYYVKGQDYKDAERDHTGGILREETAIKSVGGQLVLTDDITFSATTLLNRSFPIFSKEVSDYLAGFSSRYSAEDVLGWLERARPLKVLVVGESIIDEYQYTEAIGKSSKEPMLAVKCLSSEKFAGGILAVANHTANFCDRVELTTFLGSENSQEAFIREALHPKVEPNFLYRKDSPTIVKRRFIESYFFTKLLEVYEINDNILDPADSRALCDALRETVPGFDVVTVVDFGHEMLTREAIEVLCREARFLAVNAQSNAGNLGYHSVFRYPRADYVCLAEKEIRLEARDRRGDLKGMAAQVSKQFGCPVTVTRGKRGSLSYSAAEGFSEVPAFATQVLDRMGAGDAFLSLAALCVAVKAPLEVVNFIGNVVGAEAVATVGHRTSIERAALCKHIESLMK